MGGLGSGNWYRWDSRGVVENYRHLDVNRWVREGIIRGDHTCCGGWKWLQKGETVASIGYEANVDSTAPSVRLQYTVNDTEKIDYRIPLTRTYPPFGGVRWWFVCPGSGCGRRVGKLYGGRYFLCRHCHSLGHQSQREPDHDRLISKAQKIRMRLGGSANLTEPFPEKPMGMHWRTYSRLYQKAQEAEYTGWIRAAARFGPLDRFM